MVANVCAVCGTTKNIPDYDVYRCRDCSNAKTKRWRDETRRIIREAKNVPCADCENIFPFYVMDFDHVRGEKLFALADAQSVSRDKLYLEIEKCDIVCANCHRIRTYSNMAEVV